MLVNDLSLRIRANEQAIHAAINNVIASGWLVLGPNVKKIAKRHSMRIDHPDVILPELMGQEHVGHRYVIRSSKRDSPRVHLRLLDITSDVQYPMQDHRQHVFGQRFSHALPPNTERLAAEILTLPCYPEMTEAQVEEVVAGVNSWRP